jgi:hypothetical protein
VHSRFAVAATAPTRYTEVPAEGLREQRPEESP